MTWQTYSKLIPAAVAAALILLQTAITDGVTASEWITIALAFLGALGVYAAPPNKTTAAAPQDRPTLD